MTKKDYITIAAALRAIKPVVGLKVSTVAVDGHIHGFADPDGSGLLAWRRSVKVFAEVAARDNPAFDRAIFYRACGDSALAEDTVAKAAK